MTTKVFIGVGHGGSDPGAVANGIKEKDANLTIALACQKELVRHGVTVLMSRTKDDSESLREKINECNAFAPDLAADIHNNAGGGDGAEVFHHVGGGKGKTLAVNILNAIKAIGQNSRGVKTKTNANGTDYFGFIRETNAPAVIVECAFLDNAKDVTIIDTVAEQQAMGVAIAKGFLKTLGIAYIPVAAQNSAGAANTTGLVVTLPVLKKGSTGGKVKVLQALLKGNGYGLGIWGVDGDFGAATVKAVQQYQKKNGLTVDGVVGKATWKKLLGE